MNRRTFFASLAALVVAPMRTPADVMAKADIRAVLDALDARNRQMLACLDDLRTILDRRAS